MKKINRGTPQVLHIKSSNKMLKKILLLMLALSVGHLFGKKPAYVIYSSKGKKVTYQKMVKVLAQKDVVLFGELHNNPISHWLQYETTADLHKKRSLTLGAEMLEADNQEPLNDYLNDSISSQELDSAARLWSNYSTDYAPLVDFAKLNSIPFIATNIPRRYARMVFRGGFEALDSISIKEQEWIAPLPIAFDSELPSYQNILSMMGTHGSPLLVKAQAIKDATMAHFILKNHQKDHLFIHYNGAYHSNNYEGILWYLKKKKAQWSYATISTVSQEDISKLLKEHENLADFIICVDSHMTTTY